MYYEILPLDGFYTGWVDDEKKPQGLGRWEEVKGELREGQWSGGMSHGYVRILS